MHSVVRSSRTGIAKLSKSSSFLRHTHRTMKLLTHNQLICVKKGCHNNFPLAIVPKTVVGEEAEFSAEFVMHVLPKLEYGALRQAAQQCGVSTLPEQPPADVSAEKDIDFLKLVHKALLEVIVQEGVLKCMKCSREYPIADSIPNMLLNEDEV